MKDYLPMPESYSIAEIVLAIYDRGSVYDYLVDKQGHSIPVVNGRVNGIQNGLYNGMVIPETDNKTWQPFFMSPDSKLAKNHADRIKELKEDMLNMMDDGGVTATLTKVSNESGIAKGYTYSAKSSTSKGQRRLAREADEFEEMAYKAYQEEDMAPWKSKTSYPEEFTPATESSIDDLIVMANYFKDERMQENYRDVLKKLVIKLNPNAQADEIDELIDEVEGLVITQ